LPRLKIRIARVVVRHASAGIRIPTEPPVSVDELLRDGAAAVHALRRIMQTNLILVAALAWCIGVWVGAVALVELYVL